MATTILFAVSVLISLMVWYQISRKYFWPRMAGAGLKNTVRPILLLHSFRFAGLSFLMPGVVRAGLDPAWALLAAWGDFTAACLAFTTLLLINTAAFRPLLCCSISSASPTCCWHSPMAPATISSPL